MLSHDMENGIQNIYSFYYFMIVVVGADAATVCLDLFYIFVYFTLVIILFGSRKLFSDECVWVFVRRKFPFNTFAIAILFIINICPQFTFFLFALCIFSVLL